MKFYFLLLFFISLSRFYFICCRYTWMVSIHVSRTKSLIGFSFFLLGKVRKWRNKNSPVRNTARTAEREVAGPSVVRKLSTNSQKFLPESHPVCCDPPNERTFSFFIPTRHWMKVDIRHILLFCKEATFPSSPSSHFSVDSFPRLKRILPVGGLQIQRVMPVSLLFFLVNSIKLLNVVYDGQFGQQQH